MNTPATTSATPPPGGLRGCFLRHPRSIGEGYVEHAGIALRAGVQLAGAGLACLVHALLPFAFERTASRVIQRLHGEMAERARQRAAR